MYGILTGVTIILLISSITPAIMLPDYTKLTKKWQTAINFDIDRYSRTIMVYVFCNYDNHPFTNTRRETLQTTVARHL